MVSGKVYPERQSKGIHDNAFFNNELGACHPSTPLRVTFKKYHGPIKVRDAANLFKGALSVSEQFASSAIAGYCGVRITAISMMSRAGQKKNKRGYRYKITLTINCYGQYRLKVEKLRIFSFGNTVVSKYLPFYSNGSVPTFEEGDTFVTTLPLVPVTTEVARLLMVFAGEHNRAELGRRPDKICLVFIHARHHSDTASAHDDQTL